MKRLTNNGFGAIEAVLVVFVVAVLGFVGYRAYNVYTNSDTNDSQLSRKVEKKEDKAKPEPEEPTNNWLIYTSQSNNYEVAIPDGWQLTSKKDDEDIIAWDAKDITYKNGIKGKVSLIDGGRDGSATAFFLIYNYQKNQKSYLSTDLSEVSSYTTDNGVAVRKWSRIQKVDPSTTAMAMDIPKDTKQYTYDLTYNDKNIHIVHDVLNGEKDQSVLVEKLINTVRFK